MEAKKHALRQNQDGGWRLTLNTQPHDKLPSWLMDGPPGLRLYVSIEDAEQFDNETSPRSAQGSSPAPAEASGESRAARAERGARLPSNGAWWHVNRDAAFQDWMARRVNYIWQRNDDREVFTDSWLKGELGIKSKAELDKPGPVLKRWTMLIEQFERDVGRVR